METTTFFDKLGVPLNEDEVRQRGEAIARKMHEVEELKAEKKSANSTIKEREKKLVAELEQLAREVRTKTEDRQIECREKKSTDPGMIDIMRLDDNSLVRQRAMTEKEVKESRQGRLFQLEVVAGGDKSKKKGGPSRLEDAPELATDGPHVDRNGLTQEPLTSTVAEAAGAKKMTVSQSANSEPFTKVPDDSPLVKAVNDIETETREPRETVRDEKTGQELVKTDANKNAKNSSKGSKAKPAPKAKKIKIAGEKAKPAAANAAASTEEEEGDGSLV